MFSKIVSSLNKWVLACPLILGTLFFTQNANSEIDDMQTKLLKPYNQALRWDNIKTPPLWVAGIKPYYSSRSGLYEINLKPGDSVKVRIPRGENLRLFSRCLLSQDDVKLDLSDGSGLYARTSLIPSQDRHSLLSRPNFYKPQLAILSRPRSKKTAIDIALFTSRHEVLGKLAPYRNHIQLNPDYVRMSSHDNAGTQVYGLFEPGKTYVVNVCGPMRYAFENRLDYTHTESRLLQIYQVNAKLDGIPLQIIDFETWPETSFPIYVNGKLTPIGRLQIGYLNILNYGCHRLELNVTAKLYGRLLQQQQPDYLFPKLNEPIINSRTILSQIKPTHYDLWNINKKQILTTINNGMISPSQKEQTALRLARDNSHSEGATLAVAMMQTEATKNRDDPQIQTVASELETYHTFYRDIFPHHKPINSKQYMAWFFSRRLHQLGEQGKGIVAGEQFLQELLNRVQNAYFFDLPASNKHNAYSPYVYYLPKRYAPSLLRIAVDRTKSKTCEPFYVQLGEAEPILFHLNGCQELSSDNYALTLGGAGLDILAQIRGELLYGSLSGQFNRDSRINAPLIYANTFELTLPTEIKKVKIWRAIPSPKPLFIALQYRTGKSFSLSETEYRNTTSNLTRPVLELFRQIIKYPNTQKLNRPEKELQNHWLALRRYLFEEYNIFSSSVSKDGQRAKAKNFSEINKLINTARFAQARNNWLLALETFSQIKLDLRYYREAEKGIINSLFNLGENYLAELQLRSIILYTSDASFRLWAYEKLLYFYRINNDDDAIARLSAAMVWLHPGILELKQLVHSLIAKNDYELALMVGMLIPPQQQNIEEILRASYQVGWWATYDYLVKQLKKPADRAFFRAIRYLSQGNYNQALCEFQAAGPRGVSWRNQICKGRQILNNILSLDVKLRTNGIHQWEAWQHAHPAPFMWQEDASVIRKSAGGTLIYSINRDLYSKAFKGTRDNPVQLEIVGPVRVRLEARPLLTSNSSSVDGWLHVTEGRKSQLFPINNSAPAQGITLIDTPNFIAGNKIFADFEVGTGLHSIKVDASGLPFLVRVLLYRPEWPVPILPPLTVDTVNAALYYQLKNEKHNIPCFFTSCLTIMPTSKNLPFYSYQASLFSSKELMKKTPSSIPRSASLKNVLSNFNPTPSNKTRPSYYLKNDDKIHRMSRLVWIIEHYPRKRRWAIAQAAHLANSYPYIDQLQSLGNRLDRYTKWLPVINVSNSAGVRYFEEQGWQPETPTIRVKKALLDNNLNPNEQMLFGNDRLVYALKNIHPTKVIIKFRAEDVANLTPVALTVRYQLDDKPAKMLTLLPNQEIKTIPIPVPKGNHALRIKIHHPVANQFLRIAFVETRPAPPLTPIQRIYFVATKAEPVTFTIVGPAFIRINELRDGYLYSHYRLVNAKAKRIELRPDKGQSEALFRISQLIYSEDVTPVRPRITTIPNKKVPPPYAKLIQTEPASPILLTDGLCLGGQENGTWDFSLGLIRRKNFLETNTNNNFSLEDFFEPDLTYRYYSENRRTYFKTTLLEHIRRYGGAVLGLREVLYYQPVWYPINFRVNARAFYQNPKDGKIIALSEKGAYSATIVGGLSQVRYISPKMYHIPELTVLMRYLSLNNTNQYNPRDVDQDIFTTYQSNYRRYVEISDVLYFRPWLDSLPYINASLASNQHFNLIHPNNYKLDTGWKQLIGEMTIEPFYQYARYIQDHWLRRSYGINIQWNKWVDSKNLFEIKLNVTRGIDVPVTIGFLKFTWNISNGRGYLDFSPNEIDFLDIRKRNIPSVPNNVMQGDVSGY